jgi:signal peptidase II
VTKRKYILFSVLGVLTILLDQWSKIWARTNLQPLRFGEKKTVIEGYFDMRYSENPGVAFGMFQNLQGGRVILTLVALFALVMVVLYLRKTDDKHTRLHAALGLIGGGAIGNLIDRIALGKVTDFIVWRYKQHEWPAFNIADAALVIGVCLMVLDMLLAPKQPAAANTASPDASA